jgi:transcriptional regulator with XRE-family HTH domain
MPPKNLPEKLKQIRLKRGFSKTALIRALNYRATPLYPSHISQFERGERQPSLVLLLAYAELGGTCLCVLTDDDVSLE